MNSMCKDCIRKCKTNNDLWDGCIYKTKKIEYKRLLELAYHRALDMWYIEKEKLEAFPDSEIFKIRESDRKKELDTIREMLLECEDM